MDQNRNIWARLYYAGPHKMSAILMVYVGGYSPRNPHKSPIVKKNIQAKMVRSKLVEPLATDTDTHQPNPGDLHSQFNPSVHSHIFCTILVCFNRNSTRPCSRRYKLKLPCGPELLTLSVFFNSRARLMFLPDQILCQISLGACRLTESVAHRNASVGN